MFTEEEVKNLLVLIDAGEQAIRQGKPLEERAVITQVAAMLSQKVADLNKPKTEGE